MGRQRFRPSIARCEPLAARRMLTADLGWAITRGGGGVDRGSAIAVDSGGNVVVAGVYNGAIDMDPSPGTTTLPAIGSNDALIAKYSSAGAFRWAEGIGGTGEQNIQSVAVDRSGDVYAAGYFSGSIDMNPGAGVTKLTSAGQHDAFLLKLDSNGNFIWARQFGGKGDEGATALAVDSAGRPYLLGMFSSPGDYNPGSGVATLTSHGSFDVFITELDSSGNFIFAKSVGGSGEDFANGIAITPSGDPVIAGTFVSTVDFDPGSSVANHTSAGGKDVFVLKLLQSSGAFSFAKTFGGHSDDQAGDLCIDHSGNILVAGQFAGNADFDPSSGATTLTSAGSTDAFISKLSSTGGFVWAKRVGGSGADRATVVATDSAGNVFTTGQFSGSADFDPGTATAIHSASGNDIFALKLSSAGAFAWAATPQGANTANDGEGIGLDGSGNVYIAGAFGGTLDFDPGTGVLSRTAGGSSDLFVWKLINS